MTLISSIKPTCSDSLITISIGILIIIKQISGYRQTITDSLHATINPLNVDSI